MGIKKVKSPIKSKDIQVVKKAQNPNIFNQQGWDLRYKQLIQHVKKHNSFKVSKKSNSKLYYWIHKQRENQRASKSGKQNCMTEERQRKLDAISFPWEMPNCSSTSTAKPNLQSKPNKSKPPNKSKTPNQSKTPNKSKPQVKPKYNKPFRQARVELGKSSKSKAKTKAKHQFCQITTLESLKPLKSPRRITNCENNTTAPQNKPKSKLFKMNENHPLIAS